MKGLFRMLNPVKGTFPDIPGSRKNPGLVFLLIFIFLISIPAEGSPSGKSDEVKGFLHVTGAMKDFLDRYIIPVNGQVRRLERLVDLIFDRTVVGFDYSSKKTYNAAETFEKRTGNCLSYTSMFIAMARYSGLDARFQEVNDYSDWSRQGDMIVFSSHINSVVQIGTEWYEVDFQYRNRKKFWNRRIISDQRAEAHYFNNIGSEALFRGDLPLAEALLRESIRKEGSFSFPYTNLGVLFRKTGRDGEAEKMFQRAIRLGSVNHTAKLNLADLYESRGLLKKSAKLKKEIRRIQEKNPYYHFNLGVVAYENGNYERAISHLRKAVSLDKAVSEFYLRLSLAYYKTGNLNMSKKYLEKGRKFAGTNEEKVRYDRKLRYIYIRLKEGKGL